MKYACYSYKIFRRRMHSIGSVLGYCAFRHLKPCDRPCAGTLLFDKHTHDSIDYRHKKNFFIRAAIIQLTKVRNFRCTNERMPKKNGLSSILFAEVHPFLLRHIKWCRANGKRNRPILKQQIEKSDACRKKTTCLSSQKHV